MMMQERLPDITVVVERARLGLGDLSGRPWWRRDRAILKLEVV
jgi:hypothetical protein